MSLVSFLRRSMLLGLGCFLIAVAPGAVRAQLQTTVAVRDQSFDPTPTGGFSNSTNYTAQQLISAANAANAVAGQTLVYNHPDANAAATTSTNFNFTGLTSIPGLIQPISGGIVNQFQVSASASNIAAPNPLVASPTLVVAATSFSTYGDWTISTPGFNALIAAPNLNQVVFGSSTYNLSSFGIQVDVPYNFNISTKGNSQAQLTYFLYGQAFPNANISLGTTGTGGPSSVLDFTGTVTPTAFTSDFSGSSGTHSGFNFGFAMGQGTASITIDPDLPAASVLGALLGTSATPDIFHLAFDLQAAADASGHDSNPSFPFVDTSCDSSMAPQCIVSGVGANAASLSLDPDLTINIVDANGQIVPFFTFETLDGLTIPSGAPAPGAPPSTVPEPSSAWILGAGLIALLGFAWLPRCSPRVAS